MKLRRVPEDFVVTEITRRVPTGGQFGLYRLSKQSIGTPEAVEQIRRCWNLAADQIDHAGLKDRHAQTSQFVTIRSGPQADFTAENLELEYLGQTERPLSAADITANTFRIVLRNLADCDAQSVVAAAESAGTLGVPNYFDEQRFGSLGPSQQFIAAEQCRKNYEQALWLALAEHNAHDRPDERVEKQILRDHWGDWTTCKQRLQRSHRRSIVTYLVDHPDKFRKAFALLRPQRRGLYLSALQSAVWNRMLAMFIEEAVGAESRKIAIGDASLPLPLPWPEDAAARLQRLTLPLPSARCKGLSPTILQAVEAAAAHYELTLAGMKISFPRDRFFSRSHRPALLVPGKLQAVSTADTLYSDHQAVTLSFSLPPGSYATMVVKAATAGLAS